MAAALKEWLSQPEARELLLHLGRRPCVTSSVFNPHFRDRALRRFILLPSSKELRATLTAIVRADLVTALPLRREVLLSLSVRPSYIILAITHTLLLGLMGTAMQYELREETIN